MDLIEEFAGVIDALQSAKIEFAVCGGFALAVHGLPRYTKDIDLLILQPDLEFAIETLKRIGFDFDAGFIPFATNNVRRISKVVGSEFLMLYLLIVNELLAGVWNDRIAVDWNAVSVPAVSATGLARMKRIAGRLQDLADIERLGFKLDDPAIQP